MVRNFSLDDLKKFLHSPSNSYFNGNTKYEKKPERAGFYEITATDGDFSYRDSFTGHTRSRGMEIVRHKNIPVWSSLYGGGMVNGHEKLADKTFEFLKKAFNSKKPNSSSFRGPKVFKDGDWTYKYDQKGNIEEFSGYEEIKHKGKLVFYHRIIGGTIKHK